MSLPHLLGSPQPRAQLHPLSVTAYHELGELGLIPEKTELLRGLVFKKLPKSLSTARCWRGSSAHPASSQFPSIFFGPSAITISGSSRSRIFQSSPEVRRLLGRHNDRRVRHRNCRYEPRPRPPGRHLRRVGLKEFGLSSCRAAIEIPASRGGVSRIDRGWCGRRRAACPPGHSGGRRRAVPSSNPPWAPVSKPANLTTASTRRFETGAPHRIPRATLPCTSVRRKSRPA